MTLYPNPAKEQFQVEINESSSEYVTITLRTLDGKIIDAGMHELNDLSKRVKVMLPKSLAAGIIIVEIQLNDRTVTKRLVIE